MPLPAGIATVTVTGTLYAPDGTPSVGSVDFIPSVRVLHVDEQVIVLPDKITAQLTAGVFSKLLPAGDDGNPSGSTLRVVERVEGGSAYNISLLTSNGVTQDLSALAPVATNIGTAAPPGMTLTENPPGSGFYTIGS